MRQRMTSQAGFTLVELLVAVAIMAVGILGLAQLQIAAMQTSTHSAGMMGANALGQRVIEEIQSFPFDSAEITNAAGQPFLASAAANSPLIYTDSRVGRLVDYSNVVTTDPVSGQVTANYQVAYTTVPDDTGMAALGQPIRVCRVDIRVTDLSESKFRNFVDLTTYKNWAP